METQRRKVMHPAQVEAIALALLQTSDIPSSQRPLRRQLTRLLALGQKVTPAQLATAMHSSVEEIRAALHEIAELEYDEQGNIVGKGLTLLPTAHQLYLNHHPMFTWCAWDALYFPVLLSLSAQVISQCPVTAETIRFTVTAEQIADLDPKGAVISLVISDATASSSNVRETFCCYSHFFSSSAAPASWQKKHPDALLLSVEEAYQVATFVVQARQTA
jgi:alkylmercury lyase